MTLPTGQIDINSINNELGLGASYSSDLNFLNGYILPSIRPSAPHMAGFKGLTYYQSNNEGACNNGNCGTAGSACAYQCVNCSSLSTINCTNCDTQPWLQNNCNCACTYNCTQNTNQLYDCSNCSKIVCAKLHEFGLMSQNIWAADQAYGRQLRKTDKRVYRGYIRWARIVTAWMDGNGPAFMFWIRDEERRAQAQKEAMTAMAQKIGTPWSEHMAYLMGTLRQDNVQGRILMNIGRPICRIVDMIPRVAKSKRKHGLITVGTIWACLYLSYYASVVGAKVIEYKKEGSLKNV
jgi:hypothetical protein